MANAMLPSLIAYLQRGESTLTSGEIAEQYLGMKPSPVSVQFAESLLKKESQLAQDEQGNWYFDGVAPSTLIEETTLCCYLRSTGEHRIYALSLWELRGEERSELFSFINPELDATAAEENATPIATLAEGLLHLVDACRGKRVLFFSNVQQRILQKYLLGNGLTISDDTILLSALAKIAGRSLPHLQKGIVAVSESLFTVEQAIDSCVQEGELLTQCAAQLYRAAAESGIGSAAALREREQAELYRAQWAKAEFTLAEVSALPESPGVYGYRDESGTLIYVGKASNLRRRLLSYFRLSDESPAKLELLRAEAVTLEHSLCGSELEALLLEHRLISGHNPKLNTQLAIHGETLPPIAPTILLLPSTDEELCQSIWYGAGSDVVMKKLPFLSDGALPVTAESLQQFFFAAGSDEPSAGKVIASRHLALNLERYDRIDVSNCASGEELLELLKRSLEASDGSGALFR